MFILLLILPVFDAVVAPALACIRNTYGMTKAIGELFINDFTRKALHLCHPPGPSSGYWFGITKKSADNSILEFKIGVKITFF